MMSQPDEDDGDDLKNYLLSRMNRLYAGIGNVYALNS